MESFMQLHRRRDFPLRGGLSIKFPLSESLDTSAMIDISPMAVYFKRQQPFAPRPLAFNPEYILFANLKVSRIYVAYQ